MICISGAGSTVGSEVDKPVQSAHQPFRLTYFSHNKAEAARARGLEAVVIDCNRPATLKEAFAGCDRDTLGRSSRICSYGINRVEFV